MLKVWGRRSAFNVQKVLWALGELGLAHEHVDAGGSLGGLDAPEFRAMNPHGRIPVIADGDLIVWESHAILRYLAAQYGAGSLWPDSPAERSVADRWMDWAATQLQVDFIALFWGHWRTPEAQRRADRIQRAREQCERDYAILDAHLADRPFVAGGEFGLGDIPAGTTLYRYFEMGLDVPRPKNLWAWYERLQERPAYRAHVMLPFDDLFGRLAF